VFLLCGLWHGAAWNFVAWGAAHGALLVIERVGLGRVLVRLPVALQHTYVMLMVMLTWVLFRADTLGIAMRYLAAMFGLGAAAEAAPPLHRFLGWDVVIAIAFGLMAAGPYGARWLAAVGDRLRVGSLQ